MTRLSASVFAALFMVGCVAAPACARPAHRHAGTARALASTAQTPARSPGSVATLAVANKAARQGPDPRAFAGARQIYAYAPGAIYELWANPDFISTILLEPGERLSEIAAGDTARWMVTQAEGEADVDGRTIVLVKPKAADLRTNIVLVTSRRTYTIEAVAQAGRIYSTEIAWRYPERAAPPPTSAHLNTAYRIRTIHGSRPPWLPTRVVDDGRRTWIETPPEAQAGDLPPLFIATDEGVELANYRIEAGRYVVDRVFDTAELRLGLRAPVVVRIERKRGAR